MAAAAAVQRRIARACPLPLLRAAARAASAVVTSVPDARSGPSAPGALLQRLVTAVVITTEAALAEAQQQQEPAQPPGFLRFVVSEVLTAPHLGWQLHPETRASLLRAPLLRALLHAAQLQAAEGRLTPQLAGSCLANVVQLLVCPPGAQRDVACSSRAGHALGPSPVLVDMATAAAYASCASQLLAAACSSNLQRGPRSLRGWDGGALWPLCSQAHLLQLMDVLGGAGDDGMLLFAGYCVMLVCVLPEMSEGAGGAGPARPRDQPPSSGASGGGAAAGADDSSASAAAEAAAVVGAGGGPSALNTLAFAPPLLPALWRWLCLRLGLPLEAPLEASRGLVSAGRSWAWWLPGRRTCLPHPRCCWNICVALLVSSVSRCRTRDSRSSDALRTWRLCGQAPPPWPRTMP